MKRERKELLLKDLCARLPYGIKIKRYDDEVRTIRAIDLVRGVVQFVEPDFLPFGVTIERPAIQPYLRPLSSMTEEEYNSVSWEGCHHSISYSEKRGFQFVEITSFTIEIFNWLNAHYFDYRGLIKTSLALEAPEGMYKIE